MTVNLTATTTSDQTDCKYDLQQDWFDIVREEWEVRTQPLRGQKLQILEIGSFEGASTKWMLDNLMDHPESSLTAIDTFQGSMEHKEGTDAVDKYGLSSLDDCFRANVSKSKHPDKLHVMKMQSHKALLEPRNEARQFDFIYVDASHVAIDVLHDAVNCWSLLKTEGTMVFDNFSWKAYLQDCYNPRIAIEAFIR
ncbi:MAG: hypothetical protein M1812_005815 [Candelaria pacifica]|nr:MAG: hypothetical protein M1812_005815 [Candelaria pacifica]